MFRNLSEKELLEKEDDWWEREDEANLDWVIEGVNIFRNLSRLNIKEIRYKETLGYLLLLQGEDLKLRQESYEKATSRFNQVVKLEPDNARAYYRLGFLYYYQEEWAKSIDSFQQSLNCTPRKKRNRLLKDQQVKAHYYILTGTQIILKEYLKKVDQIPAEDLMIYGEIKHLVKELKENLQQEKKPYQMIVNGIEFRGISEREYEELSDPFENKNCIILNFKTTNDVTLSLNNEEIHIPTKLVPLLELIMRYPEGVSHEEIIERKYEHSKDPHAMLRRYISRLRDRLEGLNPPQDLIITVPGGYQWSPFYEFRIFKHYRDVSTDLLPD